MPYPNYYSPELVRKAAEAIREEQQRVGDFEGPARRALFNNAVDRDLFDSDVIDDIADEQGLDPSDVDIRSYRDASDFPDYIPYSNRIEVDPDFEDYTGYRLAGQNPKVREFLRDPSNIPDDTSPEFLDQVYEDVNAGRVNPNDLRDVYTSFQSRVLDDADPTPEQWEAANFVERAGTRDRSSALDPSIYEGFTSLEEDLGRAMPVTNLRDLIETDRREVNEMLRRREQEVESTGGLFQDESRAALERFRSRVPTDEAALGTRRGAVDARNRLYNLQRDLVNFTPENPYTVDLTERRNALGTVLPSVIDAIGEDAAADAVRIGIREQRNERNRELRERSGMSVAENNRRADSMRPGQQRRYIEQDLERLNSENLRPKRMTGNFPDGPVITGLEESVRESELADKVKFGAAAFGELEKTLRDYPEVERLLTTPVRKNAPQRIREGSFKPYMQFADTQQQVSMPADRATVYADILSGVSDPALADVTKNILSRAEDLYTSGSTADQAEARGLIASVGGESALQSIEQPAFRPKRPIVGGGEYINVNNPAAGSASDELTNIRSYMDTRARRVNQALRAARDSVGEDFLVQRYPGAASPRVGEYEAAFKFDEDTGEVFESDPSDRNTYRVRVNPARTGEFYLEDSRGLSRLADAPSINAMRFLRDNPVTGTASISFDTAKPGKDYSGYSAQTDLPDAISRRFGTFVNSEAMKPARAGALITNSPVPSRDLYNARVAEGKTADTSSTIRKLEPFVAEGESLPSLRGSAYMTAGFGPVSAMNNQYAYIDADGNVVPLQVGRTEKGLRGEIDLRSGRPSVAQDVLPLSSTPRYYQADPVTAGARGALEFGRAIRRTPSALLPGAADLIPSPEAIQTGFREGPLPMVRQMGREFAQGLPVSFATASTLALPTVLGNVPLQLGVRALAPGIGAGMVTVAAARAANEAVKQQTGEGIVPKLRQVLGTEPRTGVADRNRAPLRATRSNPETQPIPRLIRTVPQRERVETERARLAQQASNRGVSGQPARIIPTRKMNPILREIQNRLGLARSRFNLGAGEGGFTELFLGR
jgi:hypothetical protein